MLHVDKVDSLQTEKVNIRASGLVEWSCYTFILRLHYDRGTYASFCVARSDSLGCIDLSRDAPIRGTYTEVDQMGLFISIEPTQSIRPGHFFKTYDPKTYYYTLQLLDDSKKIIDEIHLKKHWKHPLVEQINVEQNGLYGTLFKPPGKGPFPAVIFIPGSNGMLESGYAAVLASEGFLTFTFAYFAYKKDLPKLIPDVDIEFFEKPIEYVQNSPYCSGKIGLVGQSFGGLTANYLSTKYHQVSAVVALNCSAAFCRDNAVMKENGKPMETQILDEGMSDFVNQVLRQKPAFRDLYSNLTPTTSIPWARAPKNTAYRIVQCYDDMLVDAVPSIINICGNLRKTGHHVESELVPGGHFLYFPYFPHHGIIYNAQINMLWGFGGECYQHSKSQETTWKKNVEFFKKHLGDVKRIPEWKRESTVTLPVSTKSSKSLQCKL
ncbi:BAAT_C domain-containing protein [Caenorhabditis elegans]|uniref:BAAT_C domain-containing protein n=1 Tax=Caenorhabditis elegans TaxID=6239 RepID=O01862_CAEEL|nr:BAAT_C domain-containing protein [Caenorhabditis elegans]CCD73360.2 BAAT_C domain-containing protein [Caenorhabditis elegans]